MAMISEPTPLEPLRVWELAVRVRLETAGPPPIGKEIRFKAGLSMGWPFFVFMINKTIPVSMRCL